MANKPAKCYDQKLTGVAMVKTVPMRSFIRLSPHLRGEIWGLHRGGYTNRQISGMVVKEGGVHPSKDAVGDAGPQGATPPLTPQAVGPQGVAPLATQLWHPRRL